MKIVGVAATIVVILSRFAVHSSPKKDSENNQTKAIVEGLDRIDGVIDPKDNDPEGEGSGEAASRWLSGLLDAKLGYKHGREYKSKHFLGHLLRPKAMTAITGSQMERKMGTWQNEAVDPEEDQHDAIAREYYYVIDAHQGEGWQEDHPSNGVGEGSIEAADYAKSGREMRDGTKEKKINPGLFNFGPCEMWLGPGYRPDCCMGSWLDWPACLCYGFNSCLSL